MSVALGQDQLWPVVKPLAHLSTLVRRWTGCACLLLALFSTADSHATEVIVNSSVQVSELSQRELRAIYTMRLDRWNSGAEIQVFVLPPTSERHQEFSKSVLQALPHQLQAVWYRLVYSGMGAGPIEVSSEQEMIDRVSQTPGAIGYVGKKTDVKNVQVIKIEAS